MGMFPYECAHCGGAYSRCGQGHCERCSDCDACLKPNCKKCTECKEKGHQPCQGGQFCWENNVICRVTSKNEQKFLKDKEKLGEKVEYPKVGTTYYGTYDGYGRVTASEGIIIVPEDFADEVQKDELKKASVIITDICCRSCYERYFLPLLTAELQDKVPKVLIEEVFRMLFPPIRVEVSSQLCEGSIV